MRDTSNITKMENVLDSTTEILEELKTVMSKLNANLAPYHELNDYYFSEEHQKDLEDDQIGEIPKELKRGVLSEDGIWNLGIDYQECAMQMMELGLKMLRNN